MKRRDLVRAITENGAVLYRQRGGHDIYRNPITGAMQPVPRHREIDEFLARAIIRALETPEFEESQR